MQTLTSSLAKFFGVAVRGQTYLNTLYLLLSFPLGTFYFIFLVVGFALGLPLTLLWVGLLVLLVVFAGWYGLLVFERQLAIWLLREDIPPMLRQNLSGMTTMQKFGALLTNPVTWKGLVYLVARFPMGIFSFCVLITLLAFSGSLIAAPFYYQYVHPDINLMIDGIPWNPAWIIDTPFEAALACIVGIFSALVSMHILNGLAWVSGKFARMMLGNFSQSTSQTPPAIEQAEVPPATIAAG